VSLEFQTIPGYVSPGAGFVNNAVVDSVAGEAKRLVQSNSGYVRQPDAGVCVEITKRSETIKKEFVQFLTVALTSRRFVQINCHINCPLIALTAVMRTGMSISQYFVVVLINQPGINFECFNYPSFHFWQGWWKCFERHWRCRLAKGGINFQYNLTVSFVCNSYRSHQLVSFSPFGEQGSTYRSLQFYTLPQLISNSSELKMSGAVPSVRLWK
jgi:hypothetical protein